MNMSRIIQTTQRTSLGVPICTGEFVLNQNSIGKKECHIVSLYTIDQYRGQGFGEQVLRDIVKYCVDHGIKKITVDDMSDRAYQSHNIYTKCGFKYKIKGFPEMELKL